MIKVQKDLSFRMINVAHACLTEAINTLIPKIEQPKVIQQIQYFEKEFKKFNENYIKSNEPIGEYKIEKKEKKDKIKKLFNFLIDFIEEIPNLNYILERVPKCFTVYFQK